MEQMGNATGIVTPLVPATVPAVGGCKGEGQGVKFRWEHAAIAVLGGATLVSLGILYSQWKQASLGRRMSGDVVDFLKVHGATVSGKKIMGGPVSVPMDVDEAVINTVDTILRDITKRATRKATQQQQQQGQDQVPPPHAGAGMPTPSSGGRPGPRQHQSPTMVPQQPGGGAPQFPEPPISGKTGLPVSREAMMEEGSISGGGYPSEGGMGGGDDFSYTPPMPPGMAPPTQMP